jgi:hypothetical protein
VVWFGGDSAVTEPFFASGTWELVLSAYCFDGVGYVRAVVRNEDDEAVGHLDVVGQGVKNASFTTPPGRYHLDVFVSVAHVYSWEAAALPLEEGEHH